MERMFLFFTPFAYLSQAQFAKKMEGQNFGPQWSMQQEAKRRHFLVRNLKGVTDGQLNSLGTVQMGEILCVVPESFATKYALTSLICSMYMVFLQTCFGH